MSEKIKNKKWFLFSLLGILLIIGVISINKRQSLMVSNTETTKELETTTKALTPSKVVEVKSNRVKKIVGYYAAWASYSGYLPDKLNPNKVTHLNYAFANISDDLKITMGYPDIDPGNSLT